MLQSYLPFLPEGSTRINDKVAVCRSADRISLLTATGPFFVFDTTDKASFRLAQANLVFNKLATTSEVAKTFCINRTTVNRNLKNYEQRGAAGFFRPRDNKKSLKLSQEKLAELQTLLDEGYPVKQAALKMELGYSTVRKAISDGLLNKGSKTKRKKQSSLKSPSTRSKEDMQSSQGIGVKREDERIAASIGELQESKPAFAASECVPNAGAMLTLPVLSGLGYLETGNKTFGSLKRGFYGLQSILLILAFMAFLRIKTPEQIKSRRPGELGILLGLDRAPEVKTLRNKLLEIAHLRKSGEFLDTISRLWTEEDKDLLGYAYIDGHVRVYHGRKHKLPKTHVARRRLCMPGTTDYWVNGSNCEPLFFVTTEANDGLLTTLKTDIIPELKSRIDDNQRITIIFDREGWSPDSFAKWKDEQIDIITYRKGNYDAWPAECFSEVESEVRGRKVKYFLGECSVMWKKGLWFREVRRLCENGHQTSIITTRQDLSAEEIACRMFFRWNQENFFRYMREEYGLDHLVTTAVEQADIERMVPNPERKEKKKEKEKLQQELARKKADYADYFIDNCEADESEIMNLEREKNEAKEAILKLEEEIIELDKVFKAMPKKMKLKEIMDKEEIVMLERERKRLTDTIKMTCYRAETELLNLIGEHFKRSREEGRTFLKNVFQQAADIVPDYEEKTLYIKFYSMSSNRENQALSGLCELMSAEEYCYPGTELRMVFEGP